MSTARLAARALSSSASTAAARASSAAATRARARALSTTSASASSSSSSSPNPNPMSAPPRTDAQNVLGGPLECCCLSPLTGWHRDGYCRTGAGDYGVHTVCARVTREFLDFTRSRGNDLETPHPPGFPGLKPGDKWCLCASRWLEAAQAGAAPPVVLEATHARTLETVSLDELKRHAYAQEE